MKHKIGDTLLGYKIVKEITGGGMSNVYIGFDQNSDNQYVIIKVISKRMIASEYSNEKAINDQWNKAIDEFKITWAIFENPNDNIAKPIKWEMSDDKNVVTIVSEFIDGPCLSKYIASQKALPIDRAMFYFKKICDGVAHFHHLNEKKTIIHRDLKSDNIMLSKDLREVKIIDYGIATSFYDNVFESSEGTIYCTANYTTPDILQLNGQILKGAVDGDPKFVKRMKEIITPQFDFHALGVILYEMLTGSFPFVETKDENDRAKIGKWNTFDLPVISNIINNIPNSIENIIFRCTASKDEDKKYRYKNVDELIADVSTWNEESRRNEPLIKSIDKRKFQQPDIFSIEKLKTKEVWYTKWWFFALVNSITFIVIIAIVIVIVVFTI